MPWHWQTLPLPYLPRWLARIRQVLSVFPLSIRWKSRVLAWVPNPVWPGVQRRPQACPDPRQILPLQALPSGQGRNLEPVMELGLEPEPELGSGLELLPELELEPEPEPRRLQGMGPVSAQESGLDLQLWLESVLALPRELVPAQEPAQEPEPEPEPVVSP